MTLFCAWIQEVVTTSLTWRNWQWVEIISKKAVLFFIYFFNFLDKGHSLCKQCLHDLQIMKKWSSSPNLSKLASCQFMKTRSLCRTFTQWMDFRGTFINDVPRFLPIFYLPTFLLYDVPFLGLSWTPLSTLIWDVINERSLKVLFIFRCSENWHKKSEAIICLTNDCLHSFIANFYCSERWKVL